MERAPHSFGHRPPPRAVVGGAPAQPKSTPLTTVDPPQPGSRRFSSPSGTLRRAPTPAAQQSVVRASLSSAEAMAWHALRTCPGLCRARTHERTSWIRGMESARALQIYGCNLHPPQVRLPASTSTRPCRSAPHQAQCRLQDDESGSESDVPKLCHYVLLSHCHLQSPHHAASFASEFSACLLLRYDRNAHFHIYTAMNMRETLS